METKDGQLSRRLNCPKKPPIAGPMMKPSPKAMPTIAIPEVRFSFGVTSATTAVATDKLPPITPPTIRAIMSIQKLPDKPQIK